MTILTNGDSGAAAVSSVLPSCNVIAWNDVLFEGPVSGSTDLDAVSLGRATFLGAALREEHADRDVVGEFRMRDDQLRHAIRAAEASDGNASAQTGGDHEIVLWFESDLYDQLQVAQLLTILGEHQTPASVVPWNGSLLVGSSGLEDAFRARTALSAEDYLFGAACWKAFCGHDPSGLLSLIEPRNHKEIAADSGVRSLLVSAVQRLVQEFPDSAAGLSRTQREVLVLLSPEPLSAGALFKRASAAEDDPFMGDWSFFRVVDTLVSSEPAAVRAHTSSGKKIFSITETGQALLDGTCDFADIATMDRWIGGVHLTNQKHWRWDESMRRFDCRVT